VTGPGPFQRRGRLCLLAQEQPRLRLGRSGVVRVFTVQQVEHRSRELPGAFRITGHERQGRRVDRGVIAAGLVEDRGVQLGRSGGEPATLLAVGSQRKILGDARVERRNVFGSDSRQAVLLEAPGRLVRCTRSCQRENGAVFEPQVVGVLAEPPLREVERAQELAFALL
jgi:hypothetical protein